MSKRTTFTTITPLPRAITRAIALDFLHDHQEMIDLNPLVMERHPIPAPPHAEPEEVACHWYSITDKIPYIPGLYESAVTYTGAFHDLPLGLQTHCYAPMGLELRSKWSVGGSMPGEPPEPVELGLGAPEEGLYLREDVDMRCNILMAGFVKKTIKKGHGTLVDRLAAKGQAIGSAQTSQRLSLNLERPGGPGLGAAAAGGSPTAFFANGSAGPPPDYSPPGRHAQGQTNGQGAGVNGGGYAPTYAPPAPPQNGFQTRPSHAQEME